ncbi:MAG: O-antigen ligase family protein [Burkholderiales bacterium]
MSTSHRRHRQDSTSTAAFVVAALLVVLAPLYRGGNRPLALLALELIALAGIGVAIIPARSRDRIPMGAALLVGLVALIPLLQLITLPLDQWEKLPGRAAFAETLHDVAEVTSHTITIVPFETQYAALALLPPIAAFLLAFQLRAPQAIRMMQLLVAVASVQAVIGLMQYGMLGGGAAGMRASGTYINPNHFAGLLLMVLPIALMGLAVEIGDRTRERIRGRGLMGVFKRAAANKGMKVMVAVAVIALLLVAIIFSRSRAGITIAALGIAITTFAVAPRVGGPRAYGIVGVVLALVIGLATAIGLIPVIDRFSEQEVLEDDRWTMAMAALEMAGAYFPVGSGVGTFAALYPPYQPAEILAFVHRAHDDYIEWVVEGGLLAMLAIVSALALYVARLVMLAREIDKNRVHYLQVGAAIGLLLMGLHSLVDFNLRIPANSVVFALLGGTLFARHHSLQLQESRRRRAHLPTAPIPVAPVPQLDPDAAARVQAVWAGEAVTPALAAPVAMPPAPARPTAPSPAVVTAEAGAQPDPLRAALAARRTVQ